MMDSLWVKNPIYPALGLLVSLTLFFYGMGAAKNPNTLWVLLGAYVLFYAFGYYKACLSILPFAAVMAAVFCGVTYLATKDLEQTRYALVRILALSIAIIPGLSVPTEALSRNLTRMHVPRLIVLGLMITLSFFPVLGEEVKRIRSAMRTRGAGSLFSPTVFYRAFLIPLMMRLVNISDTLSMSVETRGFDPDAEASVYRPIRFSLRDVSFTVLLISILVAGVIV